MSFMQHPLLGLFLAIWQQCFHYGSFLGLWLVLNLTKSDYICNQLWGSYTTEHVSKVWEQKSCKTAPVLLHLSSGKRQPKPHDARALPTTLCLPCVYAQFQPLNKDQRHLHHENEAKLCHARQSLTFSFFVCLFSPFLNKFYSKDLQQQHYTWDEQLLLLL